MNFTCVYIFDNDKKYTEKNLRNFDGMGFWKGDSAWSD